MTSAFGFQLAPRIAVLCVLVPASVASAEQPWEAGVAPQTRAKAQALFEEGNQLFAQQAHAPALAKYKQAIALWDHPLIRLNMAITELRLDRVLEAADHLDAALRYGAAPFEEREYRNALEQQEQIARRVGHIEVSCEERGAQVLLDGELLLTCPGRAARRVLAGAHVLVGEKDGYVPIARRVTIAAGDRSAEALDFIPQDSGSDSGTPSWRNPWIWTGAAVLAAGAGITFNVLANKDQERLDRLVAESSMYDFAIAESLLERGERRALLATTFYVATGGLAAAAITFALWPRLRPQSGASTRARHAVRIGAGAIGVTWTY